MYYIAKGKLILHLRYDFENSKHCDTPGKILRYYRQHKGYSTRKLAEMAGVTPATIMLYENDKNPIQHKFAVPLADALGIDRKLLFDDYAAFLDYPYNVLLQEVRARLSLSRLQMAQEIGAAQTAYSSWERAAKTPRRKEFEKIIPLIKRANI